MASQFDLTFAKPTMTSSKKASIKLIRGVIGCLKSSRAPEKCVQPALQCHGSSPPPLPDKFTKNFDRVLNLDWPEDEEFSVIDDEEICPIDYAEDYKVDDDVKSSCLLRPVSSPVHSNHMVRYSSYEPEFCEVD